MSEMPNAKDASERSDASHRLRERPRPRRRWRLDGTL